MEEKRDFNYYKKAYENNEEYRNYVNKSMQQSGKSLEETLRLNIVRFIYDALYNKNDK